jgi:hypothetical protein
MPDTQAFKGGCHCGALGYVYRTALASRAWPIRACQCGFCRAHAALSTSDPAGSLDFRQHSGGALQRYRFAQGTAEFLLCRLCGVYVGAVMRTEQGLFGIINTRTLREAPADLAPPAAADYESESAVQRTARRAQRWTPVLHAP